MQHYKYIDLNNSNLSQQIADFIQPRPCLIGAPDFANLVGPDAFWHCTPLVQAVETVCPWSEIYFIGVLKFNPEFKLIHQDQTPGYEYEWALNIPVLNCADTYTAFYQPRTGQQAEFVDRPDISAEYHVWRPEQVEEVERMYFTQPVLFNSSSIHCVHNPTELVRVSLTVRFRRDLRKFGWI